MNVIPIYASGLLTSCFYILIMHKLMEAFFSRPSGNPLRFVVWTVYYILQAAEAYCGQVDADGQNDVFRVSVVMYGIKREK